MKYAKRRMNDSTAPPLGELWLGGGPPYRPAAPPGEHAVQPRAPALESSAGALRSSRAGRVLSSSSV